MRTNRSYNEIYEMAGNIDFTIDLGAQIEAYRSQLESLLVKKEQEEARLAEEAAEEARQEEARQEEARLAEARQEEARQEEARLAEARQEEARLAEEEEARQEEARQEEARLEKARQEEEARQEAEKKVEPRGKNIQQMIAHKELDFDTLFDLNEQAGPSLFDSDQPGTSQSTSNDFKASDELPEIPLPTVQSVIPDNLLTLTDLDNWYENKTKEKTKKTTIDSFCKKEWKHFQSEWSSFVETTNKRHISTQREFQRTIASLQATVDQLNSKIWNLECLLQPEHYSYDKRRKWHK